MDMVVAKPFTLSLTHDDIRHFAPGIHRDVPAEVTDHWFAKAHLAKNGEMPEPEQTAPLTHEERLAMKGRLDDAEAKISAAQDQVQEAHAERDRIKAAFEKLAAEHATAKARIASLESDLDKATKPAETTPSPKSK